MCDRLDAEELESTGSDIAAGLVLVAMVDQTTALPRVQLGDDFPVGHVVDGHDLGSWLAIARVQLGDDFHVGPVVDGHDPGS